jgi:hypothetical protein
MLVGGDFLFDKKKHVTQADVVSRHLFSLRHSRIGETLPKICAQCAGRYRARVQFRDKCRRLLFYADINDAAQGN